MKASRLRRSIATINGDVGLSECQKPFIYPTPFFSHAEGMTGSQFTLTFTLISFYFRHYTIFRVFSESILVEIIRESISIQRKYSGHKKFDFDMLVETSVVGLPDLKSVLFTNGLLYVCTVVCSTGDQTTLSISSKIATKWSNKPL